jgi:threonine 3-dehydrogenase
MMDAIVKPDRGPGLELRRVPVPEAGPGEVLIKIHKTAICGSDIHIYDWNDWAAAHVKPGMTIGHEYVGEIAALGEGVGGFTVGQRVSGEGHITCGHCRNCHNGNIQWCRDTEGVGVDRNGAFAEYLVIPASNVIKIDESLDEEVVSFFDAFGNATHTALMWDLVGEDVLITGAGPIGIIAAGVCKYAGARRVVITDLNEYRLDLARKMGVDAAVNTGKENLEDIMKSLNIIEGFDVGLEMSGNGRALNQMIDSMIGGGKIALLGIQNPGTVVDWNKIVFGCLQLKGIYGREMFETWHKMTTMLQSGLDLSGVITHRLDFDDFEKGFELMLSGNSGKIVLSL